VNILLSELTALFGDGEQEIHEWQAEKGDAKYKSLRSVQKLPGDASTRRYYRVGSSGEKTSILARVEPFDSDKNRYLFLSVRDHLESSGVDVPRVMGFDGGRGYVLLEDLGDVTLLRRLQEVSSADVERHLYQRVIDSLVQLQFKASPKKGQTDLDAFRLRFDHEKLMWEMGFTMEHFYKTYLKRDLRQADLKVIMDGFSEICQYLADQPTVLTHRDFHSRNVMVTSDDRLVMIDFQDARMGPAQYDLASLLKDSYYQLEESQISMLLDYYIARWEGMSGQSLNRDEFRYVFDLMSVQRNFKAIGSFASFLNRRGNAIYLKFIGNTFENIRRTLLKYPKYSALRETLFHYYYF
jgi:aminoglycoside/choline kinase family phosphotransferase